MSEIAALSTAKDLHELVLLLRLHAEANAEIAKTHRSIVADIIAHMETSVAERVEQLARPFDATVCVLETPHPYTCAECRLLNVGPRHAAVYLVRGEHGPATLTCERQLAVAIERVKKESSGT